MGILHLQKKDIDKIQDVLSKFEDIEGFQLEWEHHGIGNYVGLIIEAKMNGIDGVFKIPIIDHNDW